ncbi:hypothetical protein K458DRAFT_183145 [Lentithecium fluviatile CBS 122367]|uniref:Uncharacterized protein n=1 Tax=Lentithecium fluviatile CBS 122367 TaxID=1168545 RepID=A0A6G1IDK4_9PLEO|nr:hypothetical protein K458DRAFT_183145 [Lentithecium fluviatile CBS 122367]
MSQKPNRSHRHYFEMQELETIAEKQYPRVDIRTMSQLHPAKEVYARGTQCLAAIRRSARSSPPALVLESSTNPLDRDMEIFLFREILSLRSAAYIADNLSFTGAYNDISAYPAARTYLHAGRARLTEESVLAHVYWRLVRWPWWPSTWERTLLGVEGGDEQGEGRVAGGSLEAVAWAVHEGNAGEKGGRGVGGGGMGMCCHGERTRGEGWCCWVLGL